MTAVALAELGLTLDAKEAAAVLGVSTWTLYETVKAGTCPVEPLRVGKRLRWPTALVLRAVGISAGGGDLLLSTPPPAGVGLGAP